MLPIRIIVGEEIDAEEGEIIGLFLKEEIPSGLSLKAAVKKIKNQGGIVYVPHPFDSFRKAALKHNDVEKIKNDIDVVEIFNSRTLFDKYNRMAFEFSRKNNFLVSVGSDAHYKYEIGNSYMEMEDFGDTDSFLERLKDAKLFAYKTPLTVRLYIKILKNFRSKR
jgi:hypothetical protein